MDDHMLLDVPAALLGSRCQSRIVSGTIEISDSLDPMQGFINLTHQRAVLELLEKFGAFDLIPSCGPIPGLTHISHMIDHMVHGGSLDDPGDKDPWPDSSPNQGVSVRAECNIHSGDDVFITGVSLPVNRPYSGCYALVTWTTSVLARETSYSPTMLVARTPESQDWRIVFASGTQFDNGLWLADSTKWHEAVVLHGAWDLHWSLDHGSTFAEPAPALWDVIGCSPWGPRCIYRAELGEDDLRVHIWERTAAGDDGALEQWSLPILPGSEAHRIERKELPLDEALGQVARTMTEGGEQPGPLRVSVREDTPEVSFMNPRTWGSRPPLAEPRLSAQVGDEWHEVPLSELLLDAFAEASLADAPNPLPKD